MILLLHTRPTLCVISLGRSDTLHLYRHICMGVWLVFFFFFFSFSNPFLREGKGRTELESFVDTDVCTTAYTSPGHEITRHVRRKRIGRVDGLLFFLFLESEATNSVHQLYVRMYFWVSITDKNKNKNKSKDFMSLSHEVGSGSTQVTVCILDSELLSSRLVYPSAHLHSSRSSFCL